MCLHKPYLTQYINQPAQRYSVSILQKLSVSIFQKLRRFTMKCVWIFTLAFGICISLCDAQCYQIQPQLEIDSNGKPIVPTECVETDRTRRDFDTKWKKDCMDCSCSKDAYITCCFNIPNPVGYDKENCESIFNKDSCSFTVVKKDNPKEHCKVTSYIG
uniref:Beta-microseminoprotein n=1 Tax=Geotrypetes seraphini TaxID=260995 RepID=A0A6P8QM73_GEOSA|nr:beta-microseminoprotein [Geotrypetes seraphini]